MAVNEPYISEINVPSKMRDGADLYTDVCRPNTPGRYPAILIRSPYSKRRVGAMLGDLMDIPRIVSAGYVLVIQDIRGSGASGGEFRRYETEMADSYDPVEWVAMQPWCNGNVGMYGVSALGVNQWRAAIMQPPHLKAICPGMATSAVRRGWLFLTEGGVFRLHNLVNWYVMMCAANVGKADVPPDKLEALKGRVASMQQNLEEQFRFLPLKDIPGIKIMEEIGMGTAHPFADYVAHLGDDDYWKQILGPAPLEKVTVPAFQICGYLEDGGNEAISSYMGMRERGGTLLARQNQKLILGPWMHGRLERFLGDLDFGEEATGKAIDALGMQLRWFDYWLKGIDNGMMDEPPVKLFVMGDNVWRDENKWPLARTQYTPFYFHSSGRANSRFGDGILSIEAPGEEPVDSYTYDPMDPAPSVGGLNSAVLKVIEVEDQEAVEKRNDVLVFTSAPLEADIEVTGPIVIKLFAISSAVDTDFTGKLVDVWPNGKAYNLADGIVRARYRKSVLNPEFIEPGKVYEYGITLRATSNVFKAGHRIRVQISSSNFPKWDRNPNTGHTIGQDAETQKAVQTIYHNGQYPSHILLPVIPREGGRKREEK